MQNNYSSLMVGMQLGNPSNNLDFFHSPTWWSKVTKSSLFLKTMISDFFLSSGSFLNHNSINKPVKNNKRMLIAAIFNFEDPVRNDF